MRLPQRRLDVVRIHARTVRTRYASGRPDAVLHRVGRLRLPARRSQPVQPRAGRQSVRRCSQVYAQRLSCLRNCLRAAVPDRRADLPPTARAMHAHWAQSAPPDCASVLEMIGPDGSSRRVLQRQTRGPTRLPAVALARWCQATAARCRRAAAPAGPIARLAQTAWPENRPCRHGESVHDHPACYWR